MHHRQRRCDPRVGEVGEERLELTGREHALVDDGAGAQTREVDTGVALGPLAQDEGEPLEVQFVVTLGTGHEDLPERRHRGAGRLAHHRRVGRQFPPAQDGESLVGGDGFDGLDRDIGLAGFGRQERRAHAVAAGRRQLEAHDLPVQPVGDLDQDAGTVTGVGLAAGCTPVLEVAQCGQCLRNDLVTRLAGHGRHERHATGVVLERRVVQAGGGDHAHSWIVGSTVWNARLRAARGTPLARSGFSITHGVGDPPAASPAPDDCRRGRRE